MKPFLLLIVATIPVQSACVRVHRLPDSSPLLATCPIHDTTMEKDVVEALSGHISYDLAYLQEARRSFLYARRGPVTAPFGYTHAEIFYCADCRAAEAQYCKERWGTTGH